MIPYVFYFQDSLVRFTFHAADNDAAWHIVKGYNVLTLKNRLTGKVVRDCTAPIEFLARLKKEITEGNLHDASILIREEQKKPLFEEFTYHGSEYQRLQMYYNTKKILST